MNAALRPWTAESTVTACRGTTKQRAIDSSAMNLVLLGLSIALATAESEIGFDFPFGPASPRAGPTRPCRSWRARSRVPAEGQRRNDGAIGQCRILDTFQPHALGSGQTKGSGGSPGILRRTAEVRSRRDGWPVLLCDPAQDVDTAVSDATAETKRSWPYASAAVIAEGAFWDAVLVLDVLRGHQFPDRDSRLLSSIS